MARRSYTDDERETALDLYVDHGPAEASRITGIPIQTISTWAVNSGRSELRSEQLSGAVKASKLAWEARRADLSTEIGAVAELALRRCREGLESGEISAKDAAVVTAVMVDKAQLLTGGATARSEHATSPSRAAELLSGIEGRRHLHSVEDVA